MQVRDLGTLLIDAEDGAHEPGGRKPATLLALLLLSANRRVSVDAAMGALWGEDVRPGAASTLESHVWRLRRVLEPGRARGEPARVLVNDSGGYRLLLRPDQIDSQRFAALVDDAAGAYAHGDYERCLRRADDALALWRGPLYGPLADEQWATAAVGRLQELRGQVQERRIDALLALRRPDAALAELELLIDESPFRERFWAQRMLALYRSGRAEAALGAYQQVRTMLLDEVGLDPGADLQSLQQRILAQDRTLAPDAEPQPEARVPAPRGEAPAGPAAGSTAPAPTNLPTRLAPLIGRDEDLRRLRDLVARRRLVTIAGPAGAGKTRLAIEVARAAAERFADGVVFVDLAAIDDASLITEVIASTIGLAGSAAGTPRDALADYLSGRRALIVLDNCEHVRSEVRALLGAVLPPGDGDSALLLTSREPMSLDGEVLWRLGPLAVEAPRGSGESGPPAVELFIERLEAADPTIGLDPETLRLCERICRAVDGLPLAIELAAARAGTYTLAEVAEQVSGDPIGLGRSDPGGGGSGGDDGGRARQSLSAAIEWSHQLLAEPELVAHRGLSVLPGPFTLGAARAAAAAPGLPEDDVVDVLPRLVHRSLLSSARSARPGGPSVFRQLAVVRAHAQRALADAGGDETAAAVRRRDDWVLALLAGRPRTGLAPMVQWHRAVDDDYAAVRATLQHALIERADPQRGAIGAAALLMYWYYRGRTPEAVRWLTGAAAVADQLDSVEAIKVRLALASALSTSGRVDLARPALHAAAGALDLVPDDAADVVCEGVVKLAAAVWATDEFALVKSLSAQADQLAARAGDADSDVVARAARCLALIADQRLDEAAALSEQVHERASALSNPLAMWTAAGARSVIALLQRDPVAGGRWSDRVIDVHVQMDSPAGPFVETRANFAALSGDHRTAATLYAVARAQTRQQGMVWPRRPLTNDLIAQTRAALTSAELEAATRAGEQLSLADVLQLTPTNTG